MLMRPGGVRDASSLKHPPQLPILKSPRTGLVEKQVSPRLVDTRFASITGADLSAGIAAEKDCAYMTSRSILASNVTERAFAYTAARQANV